MADKIDPFQTFGSPPKPEGQPSASNQFTSESGKIDPFKAFGSPEAPRSSNDASDDAYEAKVRSLMPKAQKYVEESGPVVGGPSGAFLEGVGKLGEWTGLRTGVRGAMAALGAGEGKNFSERYEQLKAEDEAVKRAFQEKHPVLTTAGELAGVAAAVPAGLVAAPVEAALAARGAAPLLAGAAGMGAEGAAFGAGTAAAEHAFGTDSKQNEPGIVSSALVGGGLGAGLGLGAKAAGKAWDAVVPDWVSPSYAYEKFAPDFVKNMFGEGKKQAQKVMDLIGEGNGAMSMPDWVKAREEGKPVTLYHLIDPSKHDELEKMFEGRPGAAKILQDRLATWAGDAQGNLKDFVHNLLLTKSTPAEMESTAKALAAQRVEDAYAAAKQPGNGAGSWDPAWNKYLNTNTFTRALDDTIAEMQEKVAFRTGDPANYQSPFKKVEPTELQTDPSDARAMAESYFAKKGVEAPDAIEHLGEGAPAGRYQLVDPSGVDIDFLDTLQRNLNRTAKSKMSIENTPSGDVGAEIAKARNQIVDSLTNPQSKFYNPEYAEALNAHQNAQRTSDAFTYGRQIWQNATNARKSSQIADDIGAMSPREKFYVAHGLMEEAITRASRPDGSIDVNTLNKLLSNQYTKQAAMNALGPRRYEEFERHLRTQTALSNSVASAAKLGAGSNYEAVRDVRYLLYALAYDRAALMTVAYRWADEFMGGAYAKDIARKLASDDLRSYQQGLAKIQNNPEAKRSFGNYLLRSSQMMGTMAGGHAAGGRIHKEGGGSLTGERSLDPRGMYSEGAETARKILPKAQGSGPELVQRLLNKGVKADELHHTQIGGVPLRHRETGELHPSLQGIIGGHELADMLEKNAPSMNRITRTKKSEDYKPVYDRGTQKLPYGSNYHEMNIAGEKKIPEQVFVPPQKELSVMPTGAISSYFREEPEKKYLKHYMPYLENHPSVEAEWNDLGMRESRSYAVLDKLGNRLQFGELPGYSRDIKEQAKNEIHEPQNFYKTRVGESVNPLMGHFRDVPNMAYHARMQDLPKDDLKNLNIEEGQSDAARRYDERKRNNIEPSFSYTHDKHKKMYEEAVAAQNRLRDPDLSNEEEEKATQIIDKYKDFHNSALSGLTPPNVPYVENNKNWQRALAKDVLHHAAKNGYESISFTPWQEQVARANHGRAMQMLHISDHPTDEGYRVVGLDADYGLYELPVGMSMDDLKKVYGDEFEKRLRAAPTDASGKVRTLKDDSYAKNPFYAFIPQHEDVDRNNRNSREQFVTEAIDNGKALRRKAEVHNAFIKQFQNVINEEHDPKFKIDYAHHSAVDDNGSPLTLPGAHISPELRESILRKGFKRFKEGGYVKDHLTQPIDPSKGYAFGGAPNERRIINNSVYMPKEGDPDFVGPSMSNSTYDPNRAHVFDSLNVFKQPNIHWTPDLGHVASRGYAVDKTGRSRRSTGGRIPEADKLFKQAKKFVDSHTKQLLNVHDDDIVKALRVAAKKV